MTRPAALYVHVPFCSRVCPYCAFTVTARYDRALVDRFLDAIETEVRGLDQGRVHSLHSIYVGGGTPTALEPTDLARLLEILARSCDVSRVREWTVEMNPGTVDAAKAEAMRRAGVTRVSIGAQSMNDRLLRRLGRTHTAEDVRQSVRILRDAEFSEINVDLIYAQMGQTIDQWTADVDAMLDLDVSHASLYELTFEPSTPFGRGVARGAIDRTEDALAVSMFHAARERLAAGGLEWYEVSNFAVPGHESIHNQVYWRNEPYFGVGPGAFGCVDAIRTTNATDVADWASRVEATGSGVAEREPLSAHDTFIETLAVGLRTRSGVDLPSLLERSGFDVRRTHASYLAELCARRLAELRGDHLVLTLDGVLLLDSILPGFLDSRSPIHAAPSAAPR